jgi:hypothetical protein
MDTRPNRPNRDIEQSGRLLVGEALEVDTGENFSMLIG